MIQHGFQPREVVVPKPIADMTTSRMLVMELLPGPKLIDGIQEYLGVWAAQQGTTLQNLATAAKEKIEKEGIPAKYDGPSAAQIHLYRRYLRTKLPSKESVIKVQTHKCKCHCQGFLK